jgi:hypothetical protein
VLSILKDYGVYSRTVIGLPVLLIGQMLMENRFRMIVAHVREIRLLGTEDLQTMDKVIAALKRMRDAAFPELIILALIFIDLSITWHSRVARAPAWGVFNAGGVPHLTPTAWYYALVSLPVYQFLIGLSLWKWILWSFFLFRLSRMNLNLNATHPDKHGGLGFLGLSPIGLAPVALAIATAIGATWRHQILHAGAHLTNFKLPAVVLLLLIFMTALGPLIFFMPKLAVVRRRGLLQYGALGQVHSTEFHNKWVLHGAGHESEFLAAPEVSTLIDFGSSYDNIQRMQPFPTDRGALAALALAISLPFLPTVLAEVPLSVALKQLLEALK